MNMRPIVIVFLAGILIFSWGLAWVLYRAAAMGERVKPLEPRQFQELTLVAVGTGGSYEDPGRLGPCIAVGWQDRIALVDAGRGVAAALRAAGIPVSQPDTVYLTSLLPVNTVGLPDLLFTGWLTSREQPLRIVGPPGTAALVEGLRAGYAEAARALGEGLGLPAAGGKLEALEVEGEWSLEEQGLAVRAGALTGGPTPALAWSFEARERRAVVSSAGWDPDALIAFTGGARLLVHEAVYIPAPEELDEAGVLTDPERLRREAALHTSILDVGDLARRARVPTLVLVRLRPPPFFPMQAEMLVDDTFSGRIVVPDDGDELTP